VNVSANPRDIHLGPRATAALCALRGGSLTTAAIRSAIRDGAGDRDDTGDDTQALLQDLRGARLVGAVCDDPRSDVWFLTDDGVNWLAHRGVQVHGLPRH